MSSSRPIVEVEVTDQARRQLSDRLEELIGSSATSTLLRSLSDHGTEKDLTERDQRLLDRLQVVLGHEEAATLMALLPLWTWDRPADPEP